MHGNVWERCWDWSQATPLATAAQTNPKGLVSGIEHNRVVRGGSYYSPATNTQSFYRHRVEQVYQNRQFGFRIVRN